jgi:hypothetical protein
MVSLKAMAREAKKAKKASEQKKATKQAAPKQQFKSTEFIQESDEEDGDNSDEDSHSDEEPPPKTPVKGMQKTNGKLQPPSRSSSSSESESESESDEDTGSEEEEEEESSDSASRASPIPKPVKCVFAPDIILASAHSLQTTFKGIEYEDCLCRRTCTIQTSYRIRAFILRWQCKSLEAFQGSRFRREANLVLYSTCLGTYLLHTAYVTTRRKGRKENLLSQWQ